MERPSRRPRTDIAVIRSNGYRSLLREERDRGIFAFCPLFFLRKRGGGDCNMQPRPPFSVLHRTAAHYPSWHVHFSPPFSLFCVRNNASEVGFPSIILILTFLPFFGAYMKGKHVVFAKYFLFEECIPSLCLEFQSVCRRSSSFAAPMCARPLLILHRS